MKTALYLSIRVLALAVVFPSFAFGSGSSGQILIETVALTTVVGQTNTLAPDVPPASSTPTTTSEPDNGLAAANRIKGLLRDHQLDQALAAAQQETDHHPDVALAWYSLGDVLMLSKRPQDAIAPLQKADALNPRMGPTLYDLGNCLAETGQYDQAIVAFSRAIDRMPDFLPAWILLYKCYGAKHDPIGAENKFQGYVNANPKSAYAWYMLGQIQLFEQLPTSAINSWQKAVDLKSDFPDALKFLGLAYAHTQQLDKAIDCYARAAAIRPDAELLNNLGYTYLIQGQTDKAIETLKQALNLDPKYEKALYNLTSAYTKKQQWTLAKDTCQTLAQINPQSAADLSKTFPASDTNPLSAQATVPSPAAAQVSSPTLPAASTNQVAPPSPASTATAAPPAVSGPALTAIQPQDQATSQAPGQTAAQTVIQAEVAPPVPATSQASVPSTGQTPAATPPPAPASEPASVQVTTQTPLQTAPPPVTSAQVPVSKAASTTYDVAPPPSWVKPMDPDAIPTPTTTDVEGGVDYVLFDNQELMDPTAVFSHYTLRMVNEQGLQNGSDIRAGFDPNYQTLTLHWLKVKRDGVWQDRLAAENFQVLRREENLDSQMLDGRYSVVCHLQDARVGDWVDFAYTVKGANPVFGGKYLDSFLTGFLRPVHLFSNQLTTTPKRMVYLKSFGGALEPTRTPLPDQSELITWKQEEVPATVLEARTSEWYDALSWVQISEFNAWKDVVDWGLATFSLNDPPSPELESKILEIAAANSRPEERALAVINFVQNDVRYLGIEMGANSYKPTPASQVFEHRFGDCKDKTQLCVVMLRALGIEAFPALVSTRRGTETDKLLPSPLAFDHAIVYLTVDGQPYWIDATRSSQRGRLQDFYVDDFKQALLLKPGTDALVPMKTSPASMPRVAVDETFLVKSMTDPVSLLIHTVFKGRSAESVRSAFNISSREEVEKAYLNYYSRNYAQIKVEQPLRSQDFPDDNRFEVWQDYTISNLWTRDSSTTPYRASFVPYSIVDAVGSTTSAPRTTPYRLDYPADISEDMKIQMFHQWHIDTTPIQANTPNFNFSAIPSLDDKTIHFKYHYETLAADVLPANIGGYNEQISRIRDRLECRLTYLPGMTPDAPGAYRPNWMALTIVGLVFGVSALAALGVYFIRPPDEYVDMPHGLERYEGIGGWLVLICIGIAAAIFADAKTAVFGLTIIFDLTKWNLLTQPGATRYDPYWAPTLLFETISCVVLLVLLALAVVLLIQKRFTFPGVMMSVLVLNLIYHSIDHALASQIASLSKFNNGSFPQSMFQMTVGCAIWIPYFLVSKRVKATFRY